MSTDTFGSKPSNNQAKTFPTRRKFEDTTRLTKNNLMDPPNVVQGTYSLDRCICGAVVRLSVCSLLAPLVFCRSAKAVIGTAGDVRTSASTLAVYSTPGDILKILSDMSWDTLFLLVGLAFVAVAVLGNISGKINPGKVGRIAAAIVGASLVSCGFWYHAAMHNFRVTLVDVAPPQSRSGSCPLQVNLQGIVDSSGSGDVIYYFEFSNGNASESHTVSFQKTDSQIVPGVWEVHESLKDAWVRLNVVAPTKLASERSKSFSVACASSPDDKVNPPTRGGTSNPGTSPAATPPVHVVDDAADSVAIDSVVPSSGTYLKRGQPITFSLTISYNLVSADSAILSISTAQLRSSPMGCAGGSGELSDAVQVPIVRGKHQTHANLTWSGDTGLSTKGRIYGSGYVSFDPMFWATNNGARANRIAYFGTYSNYCYQFGP